MKLLNFICILALTPILVIECTERPGQQGVKHGTSVEKESGVESAASTETAEPIKLDTRSYLANSKFKKAIPGAVYLLGRPM